MDFSIVHGGYAAVLKGDLASNFRVQREDKNLLSMQDNIALFKAKITELLSQLDAQNDKEKFDTLAILTNSARSAFRAGESDKLEELFDKMTNVIESAINNDSLWKDVAKFAEAHRRAAETEQKLVGLAYKMVSGDELYNILTVLKHEINTTIQDPEVRAHFGKVLKRLVSGNSSGGDSAGTIIL